MVKNVFRKSSRMKDHFEQIYRSNVWKENETRSGSGSTAANTLELSQQLRGFIQSNKITPMLDAPCGDCNWIALNEFFNLRYLGIDIVRDLISSNVSKFESPQVKFETRDLSKSWPASFFELVLMRDLLVHLTFQDSFRILSNFCRSESTFIAVTSFSRVTENVNIRYPHKSETENTLSWRPLNMRIAPFNFPAPFHVINEDCTVIGEDERLYDDKELLIYRKDEIDNSLDEIQ